MTKLLMFAFGAFAMAAVPARAGFIGDNVTVNYEWPNLGTVLYTGGTQTIAAGGTTFDLSSGGVTVDVTDSSIVVTFPGGWGFSTAAKTFDGIVVTDPSADITGVSLDTTNITGYVASDITFDTNDVYINFPYPPFSGLDAGASVTADVVFAPEPASLFLIGAGLLGIAAWRRRAPCAPPANGAHIK
jgi:hypothetical protein